MNDMRPLMPEDDGVKAAVVRNLAALLTQLCEGTPGASLRVFEDVLIADIGVPNEVFNIVTRTRFAPDQADRRIAETLDAVRATGRPFLWWVDPLASPLLPARLEVAGLKESGRYPAMRAALGGRGPVRAPEGLEIRRVSTQREFEDFTEVLAASWDPPSSTARKLFTLAGPAMLDESRHGGAAARLFVGYAEGRPACISEAVLAGGVAGLYNIITAAAFRRRGLGRAMTLTAMEAGREEGYHTVILEASEMGEPVYRKLGFETIGEFREYAVNP